MVTVERRRVPRTRLQGLVYIGIGTDNGGVVLDVSDGGLSFHAVACVQQDSPNHFSLSAEGRRRVEGFAEVAWNSAAGKCAGLRFTHLPEEVREQIQIWSNQPRLSLPAAGEFLQPDEMKPAPNSMEVAGPASAEIHSALLRSTLSSPPRQSNKFRGLRLFLQNASPKPKKHR